AANDRLKQDQGERSGCQDYDAGVAFEANPGDADKAGREQKNGEAAESVANHECVFGVGRREFAVAEWPAVAAFSSTCCSNESTQHCDTDCPDQCGDRKIEA